MRTSKGFTLIELLIALLFFPAIISFLTIIFAIVAESDISNYQRQNLIGILQMRQFFALSENIEINENRLCMLYNNSTSCFYEQTERLIKTPGTEIYLIHVSSVSFSKNENNFEITFDEGQGSIKRVVAYQK